ncbi:undecaprenyl-diphosphate phosphatase [Fusibacter tunisiensis]|uniref:Undecaprenyl-diphosphatase n=1 Tax=Fusibacter tunisiensis TaxID=1008308 RepID=A0ABS2MTM5_9FIRM|nr:undecaprenyl-diphosphate phosphatase [Fusibacter tunisiensis]MBM7562779.1 undecaprenyl-diphosphatase [Fusibacter tunisiensis]
MEVMDLIKVIILGVVEGITEWLPISSTGHMILVDEFIKLNVSPAFMEMFLVVIQLGAILAVVMLYFHKLNPLSPKKTLDEKKETLSIWYKVVIGVIPAGILGVLFDDWLNAHLYHYVTVAITLIFYGILFIVIETKHKGKEGDIKSFAELSYKTAFLIGVFQVLSLIPGTSRSGATIIGAIILGTSRFVAAEFSFFMSIPIMFGASAIKLLKFGFDFSPSEFILLSVGMIVAFGVSLVSIRFLMTYIKKHDFKVFGWYRIGLGLLVIGYYLSTL